MTEASISPHDKERLSLQAALDAAKTQAERNKLGQFSTPAPLARQILSYGINLIPEKKPIRFLDPAFGIGAFYSALLSCCAPSRVKRAVGIELDPHYGQPAKELWKNSNLELRIADFTRQKPEPEFNLLICNPPYVRHHHIPIEKKEHLQLAAKESSGIRLSGLAGLYCYFLTLSHSWMSDGGVAGWLIPSEFMDVNYGRAIKNYLLDRVTLLAIHRFAPEDVQFGDALVSSSVVWIQKAPPPSNHHVSFTFGGSLSAPSFSRQISASALADEPKWTHFPKSITRPLKKEPILSDFFAIKRGIATGDNHFFILPEEIISKRGLPYSQFRPILPSPRYIKETEILADKNGIPLLEKRLFLLDSILTEHEISYRYPALQEYLKEGYSKGLPNRYLCSHRKIWYSQEHRPPPPIVCTYLGRSGNKSASPFRFILNHSQATVANVWLALYPLPEVEALIKKDPLLMHEVGRALSQVSTERLVGNGRVYGGGLHKLEPKELSAVRVPELGALFPSLQKKLFQAELF